MIEFSKERNKLDVKRIDDDNWAVQITMFEAAGFLERVALCNKIMKGQFLRGTSILSAKDIRELAKWVLKETERKSPIILT